MPANTSHLLSSVVDAQRQADTINAYWAKVGREAGAMVVPVFDHEGNLESFGVTSHMATKAARRSGRGPGACVASRLHR